MLLLGGCANYGSWAGSGCFYSSWVRSGSGAYYADSRDKTLFYSIHRLNHFPINFKITKYDWRIYAKSKKEKVKPQT